MSNTGKKAVIGSPDTGLDNKSEDQLTELKNEGNPYMANQNTKSENTKNDDIDSSEE